MTSPDESPSSPTEAVTAPGRPGLGSYIPRQNAGAVPRHSAAPAAPGGLPHPPVSSAVGD